MFLVDEVNKIHLTKVVNTGNLLPYQRELVGNHKSTPYKIWWTALTPKSCDFTFSPAILLLFLLYRVLKRSVLIILKIMHKQLIIYRSHCLNKATYSSSYAQKMDWTGWSIPRITILVWWTDFNLKKIYFFY